MSRVGCAVASGLLVLAFGVSAQAWQDAKKAAEPPPATVEAIDREFDRELAALERLRLDRLAALAAKQTPAQANATYEAYFQNALNLRLYREAEPVAERVLRDRKAAAQVLYLAEVTNILAEVDRKDFKQAVESLKTAIAVSQAAGEPETGNLPLTTRMTLLELFFQKLVQNDEFTLAREALTLINQNSKEAAVRDYTAARLRRLDLVGKPAPAIAGNDLDGRPFRLADSQGQVVLVLFWASWCVPNAREVEEFKQFYTSHRDRGLRVVGVNLDTAQDGGASVETVLPNIRRFVLDYNVPWPNLINGAGELGCARAYGITEIPANVLIDRKGMIAELDLERSNMQATIDRALGK